MSLGKLRVINPGWCTERISYSRESNPRDAKAKGLERKSSKIPKKQLVVIKTRVKETKRTSDTRRIKVRSHVGISMLSCGISFGVSFPQFTSTKSFNQSPAKWHWREMFPRPWGVEPPPVQGEKIQLSLLGGTGVYLCVDVHTERYLIATAHGRGNTRGLRTRTPLGLSLPRWTDLRSAGRVLIRRSISQQSFPGNQRVGT